MNKPIPKFATEPVIASGNSTKDTSSALSFIGKSFEIHECSGSGIDCFHVHHADDQAWHVLEGTLVFRFQDRTMEASAGTTVFVPAGVPHAYKEAGGPARYLLIIPPRLHDLVQELESAPREEHPAILRWFDSEVVESVPDKDRAEATCGGGAREL